MKSRSLLIIYFTIFLSLCSYFSFSNWICSLFEHFRHAYLAVGVIFLCVSLLKKKYILSSICIICICLNASVILVFFDPVIPTSGFENFQYSIAFHNLHNGNNSKFYSKKLKEMIDSETIAFFEINNEMSKVLGHTIGKMNPVFLHPSEDNYGWGIFSSLQMSETKSYKLEDTFFVKSFYVEKWNVTIFFVHLPPPIFPELWKIQTDALLFITKQIIQTKGPILIAGDFNLTPWSYLYRKFKKELLKRGITSEPSLYLPSWPSILPLLPIDHVFSNFSIYVKKMSSLGSDHYLHVIHFWVQKKIILIFFCNHHQMIYQRISPIYLDRRLHKRSFIHYQKIETKIWCYLKYIFTWWNHDWIFWNRTPSPVL